MRRFEISYGGTNGTADGLTALGLMVTSVVSGNPSATVEVSEVGAWTKFKVAVLSTGLLEFVGRIDFNTAFALEWAFAEAGGVGFDLSVRVYPAGAPDDFRTFVRPDAMIWKDHPIKRASADDVIAYVDDLLNEGHSRVFVEVMEPHTIFDVGQADGRVVWLGHPAGAGA